MSTTSRKPTYYDEHYDRAKAADFAVSLSRMMARAGEVGLFRTMHKIHDAVRECGNEMADIIDKLERAK